MKDFVSLKSKEAQTALYACYFSLQTALKCIDRPQAFSLSFKAFYAAYDSYIAIVADEMNPRCRSGCHHCCTDNPHGVSAVEMKVIFDHIEKEPMFDSWSQKLNEAREAFHQLKKVKGLNNIQNNWKATKRNCAFLNSEGGCSIYAHRPVACRMFFSLTPPEFCDPAHEKYDQAINPHLEPSTAIKDLLKEISVELNLRDVPTDFISGLSALIKKNGE